VKSVHTSNNSLQRRGVPLSMVTSIESDYSELGDMTEMIPIVNGVQTSNESLQRRRLLLSEVSRIEK
jgi:hypothetical protein